VLLIETSETMPSDDEVYWILQSFGERGLLQQFPAVLVGRAKAWTIRRPLDLDEKQAFRRSQRDAIRRAFERYGQNPLIVFDVDFGHTEPQFVIPTGGLVRVDGRARAITVTY
jgi:muramoyltetrapeptide carboxypeptidase LdcA involved in peptidoglycan recycling